MSIIGIDLGTTNSLACVYRNSRAELIPNELGEYKTSSAVSVLEDGSVLVGAAAKERLISHPESTAAGFKVWMGTDRITTLGALSFKPEELSALVLRQLLQDAQRYLGEPVEEAVISVPAYFNDDQRCATKLAAQLAGLTVKRLINEPSAAALCHRHAISGGDCRMMIVDFGGGTLDVSIVDCFENIIEITAIAGDNHLGGDDIDQVIVEHFCRENGLSLTALSPGARASLFRQAETAKIALSGAPAAMISLQQGGQQSGLLLTRPLLTQLCEPIFQRVRQVISQAVRDRDRVGRIDDVVLVGGSAQLTVLGDFLEELFGRRPAVAAGPDEIVALGVGLCAGIKERAEDLRDLVMTDVCPFSLGVATYNDLHDKTPHMAFLIQRSSMLPASRQETFYTLQSNQQALRFEIYQGEGYFASENLKLGELEVQVPPGTAGEQSAAVTFTYDIDGILHVSARSSGGDYRDRLILNSRLHLTEEERAQALERISQIRLAAQGTQRERYLLEKALSLYQQSTGRLREAIAHLIRHFQANLEQGDRISRERVYRHVQKQLEQFQHYFQSDPFAEDFWADPEELEDTDEDTEDEE
ncbi:MAG: Hsp70 family protein [Oscillibacter sp.]|nr:Hsp70 family protein [Oscillibacter sp.]